MAVREIKPGVYLVGAQDWDRRMFDALIPLPDGTSYNSYLVKGSEKTALIDTVDPTKTAELVENLKKLGVSDLDYVISNHAEQDHSGSIPAILELYPRAKVMTNPKCAGFLRDLLALDADRFIEVGDGESVSLGDKTLEFIYAPWVHWPETMFTLLKEDKVLFTCDFLGSHFATGDPFGVDAYVVDKAAKRYYAEIMMPFRTNIQKHLEKLAGLDVEVIAPSHGPLYAEPGLILGAYGDWVSDQVKNEVVIPYVSMHGSTERMVDYFASALIERGVVPKPFNITKTDIGELATAIVDAATLVIATPTVLTAAHPMVVSVAYLVNALRPKLKFAAIIGSYGWGGKAADQLTGMLGNLKAEFLEPVIVKGLPKGDDFKALDALADEIRRRHAEVISR